MKIGFVGLGKLGLPVAVAIDYKGHDVLGYDVNPNVTSDKTAKELLYTKECGITGIDSIEPLLETSKVRFSRNLKSVLDHGDCIFVAVQTPHQPLYEGITRLPKTRSDFDYSYLIECMENISNEADELNKDIIVVIISTVLPGTLRKYILPILSKHISLCYNPYFIAMGTTIRDFLCPEFILLGVVDDNAKNVVKEFYKTITNVKVYETNLENAELIKVAYNTFISTKVTFVNTIMELCDKLPNTNIDEVTNALKLSNRRLISPAYLTGGMGDGGGCHPRDNIALSWLSDELGLSYNYFDSIMTFREKQIDYFAELIINKHKINLLPIHILGKAFKAETNLIVGSTSILLKNILEEKGYVVKMYDPYVDENELTLEKEIYFIGTKHEVFSTYKFPEGSIVIDPHRYIKKQENVEIYYIGSSSI